MKNNKIEFIKIYLDLKKERNSKFLFISSKVTWRNLSKLFFLEYINKQKADTFQVDLVILDLQDRGIIHKANPITYHNYKLENFTFHDVYIKTSDNQVFSRGTSTDIFEAYGKAFGEVFERTSIKYPNTEKENILHKNVKELNEQKIDFYNPLDFAQATDKQKEIFPNFVITENDKFPWVKVKNLNKNKDMYLPMQTIFYSTNQIYKEKSIIQQSTHGAGAGYSLGDSVKSGMFEILHRHYFFDSWYKDGTVPIIDTKTIPEILELKKLINDFENKGFEVFFLDFTSQSGIPTTICLLKIFGGLYCGGSTNLILSGSMFRSMSEAFATYLWAMQTNLKGGNRFTKESIDSLKPDFLEESANAYTRVLVYGNSYFVENIDLNIVKFTEKISYEEKYDKDENFDFINYNTKLFSNIFSYNTTNQLLEDYNYFVSRVIIPESYFFALDEVYSRPVLKKDGINVFPKNSKTSPFP